MQRYDFYFGQLVNQADLDNAFDGAEQADRDFVADIGSTGINSGLTVSEASGTPNLTVEVASGVGYDQTGRRIRIPSTQTVDLSSFVPSTGGNSRYVTILASFARELSDPRVDDNSVTVQYNRAESFATYNSADPDYDQALVLVVGAESAGTPARPAKPGTSLVLADVLLTNGDTQILNAAIDQTTDNRRDWAFELLATSPVTTKSGTLSELGQDLLDGLNNHINDLSGAHDADTIVYNPASSVFSATDVQAAIDEIESLFPRTGTVNTWTNSNIFNAIATFNSTAQFDTNVFRILGTGTKDTEVRWRSEGNTAGEAFSENSYVAKFTRHKDGTFTGSSGTVVNTDIIGNSGVSWPANDYTAFIRVKGHLNFSEVSGDAGTQGFELHAVVRNDGGTLKGLSETVINNETSVEGGLTISFDTPALSISSTEVQIEVGWNPTGIGVTVEGRVFLDVEVFFMPIGTTT